MSKSPPCHGGTDRPLRPAATGTGADLGHCAEVRPRPHRPAGVSSRSTRHQGGADPAETGLDRQPRPGHLQLHAGCRQRLFRLSRLVGAGRQALKNSEVPVLRRGERIDPRRIRPPCPGGGAA